MHLLWRPQDRRRRCQRRCSHAISGNAVEAALEAADHLRRQREEQRQALALEVEQARYDARLAARRYEAVDPDNRLVAAELEARWNGALQKARGLTEKLEAMDRSLPTVPDARPSDAG